MGPSRFERESEDPQSPRMARLPYGPAVIVFAHIPYVSCYPKTGESERKMCKGGSEAATLELLNFLDQAVDFRIGDLHLSFNCIDLGEELTDPDVHQVHDELLDNDHRTK